MERVILNALFRPPSSNFFTSSSEKSIHLVDLRSTCEKKLQMVKTKTKAANANIYAIVGSDEAEVKRVAAELASNLTPSGAGDFGLETIDGAADNAEQAAARVSSTIDALQTLPFFGSTKVVWLKNVNFLGDDPKARSTAVQSALEELSELLGRGFGSEITFLISATEVDKRRGFYKALVKRAELQVFDRIDSGRAGWKRKRLKSFDGARKNENSNLMMTRSTSLCCSREATRVRSRTSWRRSTFSWKKIAQFMSILFEKSCPSRAQASFSN